MKVTTKSLRTRAREILDCVDRGEPVTITYRGKPRAKLVSIMQEKATEVANPRDFPVFGMWSNHEDTANVDTYVRQLRKGRFDAD